MRIAQIAPIIESVPPAKYGGTERVISALTEELVKRGHEVTLFASGDSQTTAKLFSVYHTALRKANMDNLYGPNIWSLLNVGLAYQLQNQFDVIHDHNSQNNPVSLPVANVSTTPVVMTVHGPLNDQYSKVYEYYTKPYLVSISHKQQAASPDLNFIGNVYHGLDMEHYPFYETHEEYLLFVGRVHRENGVEEKGLHLAIKIAQESNLPLLIAAKLDASIPEDTKYFAEHIKPQLSEKIVWIGEVDEAERNTLMSKALCLVHPVLFPEPFGLTLIEAMACGCPVIAFDKGSIPEVLQDGKTGFIVNTYQEAIQRISQLGSINRRYCREYALRRFSASRMAHDYEVIYKKISEKKTSVPISKIFFQKDLKFVTKLVKKLQKF